MIQFTQIKKHPFENKYMLCAKMTVLFPFMGTKKQCEKMQPIWEEKLNAEFNSLPKDRQDFILSERKRIYKF